MSFDLFLHVSTFFILLVFEGFERGLEFLFDFADTIDLVFLVAEEFASSFKLLVLVLEFVDLSLEFVRFLFFDHFDVTSGDLFDLSEAAV